MPTEFIFKSEAYEEGEKRILAGDTPLCPRCKAPLEYYFANLPDGPRLHLIQCSKFQSHFGIIRSFKPYRT